MMPSSMVEFYGKHSNYACGYCSQKSSCHSDGMWAHRLSCEDYQDLIDRGWRRSGCYCYKPIMDVTCCPAYTIKCNALQFQMNKSHKKVIKRLNKFLRDGFKEVHENQAAQSTEAGADTTEYDRSDTGMVEVPRAPSKRPDLECFEEAPVAQNAPDRTSCSPDEPDGQCLNKPQSGSSSNVSNHSSGSGATNPPKKAKLLRIERKREKLQKKGVSGDDLERLMKQTKGQNVVKSLEDFLSEAPRDDEPAAHRLKIETISTSGERFQESLATSFALFAKYQTAIHNDRPGSISEYLEFLVNSPLKAAGVMGSFHQQYWLDDRLIAVGVIDVLPYCVSAVYFFYDPEFHFLSLGTYASMRELAFARTMNRQLPSLTNYYMGFYIHSCPKMRYKGNLQPSYLLCPEVYSWHSLDATVKSKLDASKYSRLNNDAGAQDVNRPTEQDLFDVLLLRDRKFIRYSQCLSHGFLIFLHIPAGKRSVSGSRNLRSFGG
ncbi:arginyl-tRNA--protein transferase 1-like isoform X3 [Anopheles albimanus]|uniref:arginyl-tRNA--protein transferase 1-like isoform X3 n=1 Tax=Anopheles albimanus TaxID=7167 RepID=UPI00163E3554|nr:arginyl-tRNA--protein transferase 1-like isoform X3 [Anopheles albimanus]